MSYENILYEVDERIARITLNRPEVRNALDWPMLGELSQALKKAELDNTVNVIILAGAGPSFCAGHNVADMGEAPKHRDERGWSEITNNHEGDDLGLSVWDSRAQVQGHIEVPLEIWNNWKPVIAQVHGFCLAGGSELATGCDVVYMAEDAQMGYPAVRFGVPDMQFHAWLVGMRRGMEMMLTGDSISGVEAEQRGWATRAYPADELEAKTLEQAKRIAALPPDIVQLNKRAVHRQMSVMGLREGIRQGTELCTLATHQPSFQEFISQVGKGAGKLTSALQRRDEKFGDYRTQKKK